MKRFVCLLLGCVVLNQLSGCTPAGVAVGGAATAGVLVAEERSVGTTIDDTGIKIQIMNSLFQKSEKLFTDVSTTVIEGRVLMTGDVVNPEDRVTASAIAWSVDGVREVINELQVTDQSSLTSITKDSWISAKLESRMIRDLEIKHINYSIDTVNSIVYIMGIAQDQAELDRVISHARDISGVRKIINHAVLKGDKSKRT